MRTPYSDKLTKKTVDSAHRQYLLLKIKHTRTDSENTCYYILRYLTMDHEQLLEQTKEALSGYTHVRFTFFDMNGVPRGSVVPAKAAASFLETGVGCFSGLQAFGPQNEIIIPPEVDAAQCGNVMVIPDLTTLHPVPWLPGEVHKTCQMLCGTFWNKDTPQEVSSRDILKRVLNKLDSMGLKVFTGAELEFVVTDKQTKQPIFPDPDYMVMLMHAEYNQWIMEVEQNATKAGIKIATMHGEYSPGQFEFTTIPEFGIKGIDACAVLKQSIKELAVQKGWEANFMAKMNLDAVGSGTHLNISLWKKDEEGVNVLWDESDKDNLSEFAKHWIAGLLHHAGALTALCCPTLNCYLRLHSPWVPHQVNWGIQNRKAMIRVKNDGPSGTYIENRLPSGLTNYYLAMAATLAAGMDGVAKKMSCPEQNDFETAPELPHSLEEALECLQKDEVMVETLGKTFVDWFVLSKTSSELKPLEGITDKAAQLEIHLQKYARLI